MSAIAAAWAATSRGSARQLRARHHELRLGGLCEGASAAAWASFYLLAKHVTRA